MLTSEWLHLRDRMQSREDLTALSRAHPEHSYDTLRAMYEQLFQRHVSRNFYLLRQHGSDFVRRYREQGQDLSNIAADYGLTPVMVARRVLELEERGADRRRVTRLLRDPSQIRDARLRAQIDACVAQDDAFGPNVDRARAVIGMEYEALLIACVQNLRLEFETEDDLRKKGSFKTPDILLKVPVAAKGKLVNWIDSKAKFADEYTMKKDYADSISSYVGRFGPGMVIYWFGFVSDCSCPMLDDEGVFVTEEFPKDHELLMLRGSQIPPTALSVSPWVTKPS